MTQVDGQFIEALRTTSVFAPELPQDDAYDTLDRVRAYERALILPSDKDRRALLLADYADGTATTEDQLYITNQDGTRLLASADHATDPVRKATGVREGADHGTAGLAFLLATKRPVTSIIPIGKQTGNAAVTPNHPLKQAMDDLLPSRAGFLSIHGMRPGKLESLGDRTEIHGIIGLGRTPNEQSREAAERLVAAAKDIGLRVVIGNDMRYMTYDETTDTLEMDAATGEPKRGRLAAMGVESTTNHAYRVMEASDSPMPAFQVEMTRALRLLPADMESGWHTDERSRAMGVHLGYMLMQTAADIMTDSQR
jgi:hypothetical protein